MSEPTRPYEPLTSENAALVLVDHQVGLMTGVRDYSTGELKHNVVALAKTAKALKLPIILTTTARDSMWGPTFPELVEALPGVPIIDRSSVNAFDDPKVARAITATGRKKLIFAGISLEVCAAFPAITAVSKGLDAYVAVDASGTFSETKRQVGLLRMLQAGVTAAYYQFYLRPSRRFPATAPCRAGERRSPRSSRSRRDPAPAPACDWAQHGIHALSGPSGVRADDGHAGINCQERFSAASRSAGEA